MKGVGYETEIRIFCGRYYRTLIASLLILFIIRNLFSEKSLGILETFFALLIPEMYFFLREAKEKRNLNYTKRIFGLIFFMNVLGLVILCSLIPSFIPKAWEDRFVLLMIILVPAIIFPLFYIWQKKEWLLDFIHKA